MSESENQQESGNGESGNGRRQVLRTEREWRSLLLRAESETARFLKFYEETFRVPEEELDEEGDRLDRCALAMGWHLSAEVEDGDGPAIPEKNDAEENVPAFPAVYSLHNLPESIAVSAIYNFARKHWQRIWKTPYAGKISPRSASNLADSLSAAHRDMLLAIDAEDAMEFGLAICLMKNVHAALNRHFAEMECLPTAVNDDAYSATVNELRTALMDLRDICLRILRDARRELAKAAK